MTGSAQAKLKGYNLRPDSIFLVVTKKGPGEAGKQLKRVIEGAELEQVAATDNMQMLKVVREPANADQEPIWPGISEGRKRREEEIEKETRRWKEIANAEQGPIWPEIQRRRWEEKDRKGEEEQDYNHQPEEGRSKASRWGGKSSKQDWKGRTWKGKTWKDTVREKE